MLIKWKPGFSGKMFWTFEISFKSGFTVYAVHKRDLNGIRIDDAYSMLRKTVPEMDAPIQNDAEL
jgi:hypothetical protein